MRKTRAESLLPLIEAHPRAAPRAFEAVDRPWPKEDAGAASSDLAAE